MRLMREGSPLLTKEERPERKDVSGEGLRTRKESANK